MVMKIMKIHSSVTQNYKKSSNEKVLKLPSENEVDRFSIVADGSAESVTIFNVPKTAKNIIKCHSSVCKMLKSSTRNIKYLCKEINFAHIYKNSRYFVIYIWDRQCTKKMTVMMKWSKKIVMILRKVYQKRRYGA